MNKFVEEIKAYKRKLEKRGLFSKLEIEKMIEDKYKMCSPHKNK